MIHPYFTPIASLIAGILILIFPELLNIIVGHLLDCIGYWVLWLFFKRLKLL